MSKPTTSELRIALIKRVQEIAKLYDAGAVSSAVEAVLTQDKEKMVQARIEVSQMEAVHRIRDAVIEAINAHWPAP